MGRVRSASRGLVAGAAIAGVVVACSAGDGKSGANGGAGASGGGSTAPTGGAGGSDLTSTGAGATGAGGGECAEHSETAQPAELNMFVSFDKSGSMEGDKWNDATAALRAFFQDPGTDGLRVAMRFFGDDLPGGAGCSQYLCNLAACAVPHIDADYLLAAAGDAHEQALIAAIDARQPGGGGGTPIHPALHGATTWAANYKAAHPADEVVVVLVTDGAPEGCIENVATIAAVAQSAHQDHGVRTYAVGLQGSHQGTMEQIASAGGTGQAIFINAGDVTGELLAALQQIQLEASLPCEYAMPQGDGADPSKVNVSFTPGGGAGETIGQVASAADCGAVANGWYYDDPAQPTRIILCPQTCDAVQGDDAAQIDIVLGCDTQVAVPE